jgi:hypothetical protein
MAQLAHIQSQVIPASTRTRRVIGSAILALLVAGAVVLALTLPGNDSPSVAPENQSSAVAPSARFDGGPNEGTRGALSTQRVDSPVIRFDGGPQEGTRGAIVRSNPVQAPTLDAGSQASTRFDGGPQEGTRGAVVPYSDSTRFDGGPNEGTRGAR